MALEGREAASAPADPNVAGAAPGGEPATVMYDRMASPNLEADRNGVGRAEPILTSPTDREPKMLRTSVPRARARVAARFPDRSAIADPVATWHHARDAAAADGYTLPAEPPAPGGRLRIASRDKNDRNRSASVWLAPDGGVVAITDHAAGGLTLTYWPDRAEPLDPVERERLETAARERQTAALARAERERVKGLVAARDLLASGTGADAHPYVIRKGLASAYGALKHGDLLLIAGHDAGGALSFVQTIDTTGRRKRYVTGTSCRGAFATFGTLGNDTTIILGTGWATTAVTHEETGHPAIAAMSDANLGHVARIVRDRFPDADVVIVGDDDRLNRHNGGRQVATDAARAIGARVAFPPFCCSACRCSDFADTRACERRRAGGGL